MAKLKEEVEAMKVHAQQLEKEKAATAKPKEYLKVMRTRNRQLEEEKNAAESCLKRS